MSRLGGGAGPAAARLRAVAALHDELRRQQPLVDALADCVIVVDDDAAHDAGQSANEPPAFLTLLHFYSA